MNKVLHGSLAVLILVLASSLVLPAAEPPAGSLAFLPGDLPAEGIQATRPAEKYEGKKLFDYMDGGAERYLAYGFTEIGVRGYQKGEAKATLEIYVMGGPAEAFGIYAGQSRGEHPAVGAVATQSTNLLSLFKDRYYVRVVAMSEPAKAKELLLALAKKAAAALPGQSAPPAELGKLPAGALDGSQRYFGDPETARTQWFDGEGDVLLAGGKVKAVSAAYTVSGADLQATRAVFPDAAAAAKACLALAQKIGLKAAPGGKCVAEGKLSDDTFSALQADDQILRWVAGAADAKAAAEWLKKIQ
jgi:hypothetical protein